MQRTNITDSTRDVLFSPRGVKPGSASSGRSRKDILTQPTTTTIQTQTDPMIEETEQKQEQEDSTCAICMELTSKTKNVSVTECGHRFCTSCLLKSLQTKNTCPMCRAEIEPARKPNLEQLTANVAADLIQAEERDIDIHRRIAVIGAFNDPRGRSDMILSLCREFAFGVSHSIAGWQGTDDQTYHESWVDYEYNNYDDDDDEDDDDDNDNDNDDDDEDDEDASDDGSVHVNENGDGTWSRRGEWRRNGDHNDGNGNDDDNVDNVDTEKRDEVDHPPSYDEVFPKGATESTTATQSTTSQTISIRAFMHNVISGVVSYTLFYTFYYALPNLVSSLIQNIRQE